MIQIRTVDELEALLVKERSVVFFCVDWSVHAQNAASHVEKMIAKWNSAHPPENIDLAQINLSEQSGEIWEAVRGWLKAQNTPDVGSLMVGGAGSILWVRLGKILRYVVNTNTETVSSLVALTNQLFDSKNAGGTP